MRNLFNWWFHRLLYGFWIKLFILLFYLYNMTWHKNCMIEAHWSLLTKFRNVSQTIRRLLDTLLAWHISAIASCNLTFLLEGLISFSIIVLRTFWRTTIICIVYIDLKNLMWQDRKIQKVKSLYQFFKTTLTDYILHYIVTTIQFNRLLEKFNVAKQENPKGRKFISIF